MHSHERLLVIIVIIIIIIITHSIRQRKSNECKIHEVVD